MLAPTDATVRCWQSVRNNTQNEYTRVAQSCPSCRLLRAVWDKTLMLELECSRRKVRLSANITIVWHGGMAEVVVRHGLPGLATNG
jgi:hypothetical protein